MANQGLLGAALSGLGGGALRGFDLFQQLQGYWSPERLKQGQQRIDLQRQGQTIRGQEFAFDRFIQPNLDLEIAQARNVPSALDDINLQIKEANLQNLLNPPPPKPSKLTGNALLADLFGKDWLRTHLEGKGKKTTAPKFKPTRTQVIKDYDAYVKKWTNNPDNIGQQPPLTQNQYFKARGYPIDPQPGRSKLYDISPAQTAPSKTSMPADWPGTRMEWEDYKRKKGIQ